MRQSESPKIFCSIFSFINALKKIAEDNDVKNLKRRNPYPWLSPRIIPNSISI